MRINSDVINDGLGFEVNLNGKDYSGIITIEALQDHFHLAEQNLNEIEDYFKNTPETVEIEICQALERHPPFGHDHILIFPHHLR